MATIATTGSYDDLVDLPSNLDVDATNDLLKTDLVNDLTTGGTTKALTAEQGKSLKTLIDAKSSSADLATIATTGSYDDLVDLPVNLDIDATNDLLKTDLINDLTTGGITKALTAEQGKSLKTLIDAKSSSTDLATIATTGSYDDLVDLPSNLDVDATNDLLKTDLINDLTTGGTTKALTAEQGKTLKAALDQKASTTNIYSKTESDNLLDGKVDAVVGKGLSKNDYTDTEKTKLAGAEIQSNKNIANGYAGLNSNGKVDVSQLPAITINNVYSINSQVAQLALTAVQGDVAIRTDVSKNFIHNGGSAGDISDWSELASPGVDVTSVNGKTGTVVIGVSDIATLQTSLDAKANSADLATIATSGDFDDLANKPTNLDTDDTDDLLTSDLINDLVTGGTNKALTAEQGKILKTALDNKAVAGDLATIATTGSYNDLVDLPANLDVDATNDLLTSDLVNDLVTGGTSKVLTAEQGKVIKALVDINTAKTGITTSQTNAITANTAHAAKTDNPHSVTKTQVGLGNVTNTADANKPISTATQSALNLKANLASPTFTGTPSLPTGTVAVTQTAGNNTTKVATTAFVTTAVSNITTPDATTTAKGKIQLAGDLGGSAALPSVTSVGGSASNAIHNATILANSATNSNTVNMIVKRDASGNFAAGTITANLTGNVSGTASNVTGTVAIAKGGTGATAKTAAFDALSPLSTQGDILYGGSSGTDTRLAKGTAGQVLTMNSGATAPEWGAVPASTSVADTDGNTKIQVEEGSNDDQIRFDIAGTERWKMTTSRLEPSSSGKGVYIGQSAGNADAAGSKNNAFIGYQSGILTTGNYNTAIGYQTLKSNTSGAYNTVLGYGAGLDNVTGQKNVFIGYQAGQDETGSNKLYIDVSNIATPLIYGEFDNRIVTINGDLNVSDKASQTVASNLSLYEASFWGEGDAEKISLKAPDNMASSSSYTLTLPINDGDANQALITNGSGVLSWASPAVGAVSDTDSDTKIQVEETADEDMIRFDIAGTERWKMTTSRLEPSSSGKGVYIGQSAGNADAGGSRNNIFIGHETGKLASSPDNTAIGYMSFDASTSGDSNTAMGHYSLTTNTTGDDNTAIGFEALKVSTTSNENTAIGYKSLVKNSIAGNRNTALGFNAGKDNTTGDNNVFIGPNTGYSSFASLSDKLFIDNSNTAKPLIYGDFSSNVLTVHGGLGVKNASTINGGIFTFYEGTAYGTHNVSIHTINNLSASYDLTLPINDGDANQVLTTDGSGVLSWTAASVGSVSDTDSDTKIQVEESSDEDMIRFDIAGTERWNMTTSRLEPSSSGKGVYIGQSAGNADAGGSRNNIFIGHETGKLASSPDNTAIGYMSFDASTSGDSNTAVGHTSLTANTTGDDNTAVGFEALKVSTTSNENTAIGYKSLVKNSIAGNRNTALGFNAGKDNTTGDNNVFIGPNTGYSSYAALNDKLFIDNSNTATPLIYGDFSTNVLTVYGGLGVKNASTINGGIFTFYEGTAYGTHNVSIHTINNLAASYDLTLPTTAGNANEALTTDGSGVLSWAAPSVTEVSDADNNTKIQVEKTTDDDIIRFDIDGTERWQMTSTRIQPSNITNGGIYIGFEAGNADPSGYTDNILIGYQAGKLTSTAGSKNTAIGHSALATNTSGDENTALGYKSLNLSTGGDNTAIGFEALKLVLQVMKILQ